jgi:hypothetical protein
VPLDVRRQGRDGGSSVGDDHQHSSAPLARTRDGDGQVARNVWLLRIPVRRAMAAKIDR